MLCTVLISNDIMFKMNTISVYSTGIHYLLRREQTGLVSENLSFREGRNHLSFREESKLSVLGS